MPKTIAGGVRILRDGALGLPQNNAHRKRLGAIPVAGHSGRPRQFYDADRALDYRTGEAVVSSGFPAGAFFATRERDRAFARHCAGYCGAAPATAENGFEEAAIAASWLK